MNEALVLDEGSKRRSRDKVARDIMIPEYKYPTVYEHATIREAIIELMDSYDTELSDKRLIYTVHRSMLVVNSKGEIIGFLSVRHLIQALIPKNMDVPVHASEFWTQAKSLSIKKVKDIMIPDLVTVPINLGLSEVAPKMAKHNTRRVAVVDEEGDVVGILREQELFFELVNIIL